MANSKDKGNVWRPETRHFQRNYTNKQIKYTLKIIRFTDWTKSKSMGPDTPRILLFTVPLTCKLHNTQSNIFSVEIRLLFCYRWKQYCYFSKAPHELLLRRINEYYVNYLSEKISFFYDRHHETERTFSIHHIKSINMWFNSYRCSLTFNCCYGRKHNEI